MPTTIAGTDVWSEWGPWSECSRSCGGCGIMSRVRNCRTKECKWVRNRCLFNSRIYSYVGHHNIDPEKLMSSEFCHSFALVLAPNPWEEEQLFSIGTKHKFSFSSHPSPKRSSCFGKTCSNTFFGNKRSKSAIATQSKHKFRKCPVKMRCPINELPNKYSSGAVRVILNFFFHDGCS